MSKPHTDYFKTRFTAAYFKNVHNFKNKEKKKKTE